MRPLRDMNRLGGVLFQFPPRFANTPVSRNYLRRVARAMAGDVTVVEFRNYSWLAPDTAGATFALLEELGLAYAVADEPQIPDDTVPPIPAVTNPALAYIRLHGRNADTWYRGGGGGTRYDYDYSAAELDGMGRHRRGPCAPSAPGPRAVQQQRPGRGHPQRAGTGAAARHRAPGRPGLAASTATSLR